MFTNTIAVGLGSVDVAQFDRHMHCDHRLYIDLFQ